MTADKNSLYTTVTSWNLNAQPIFVDYNITQITPFVYVTAENTARQYQQIYSNGIDCVINVANELPQMVFPPQSKIESLKYPIQDLPTFPAVRYFDTVADRIAANVASNRRTLLYCHHGRSRSITFILAYLIKHHHLSLPTAFTLVRQKRQLALPNIGFWTQLRIYDSYQQQKKSSKIFPDFQNSLKYGEQILQKISNGMQQILPYVNPFPINPNYINRNIYWFPINQQVLYPYRMRMGPGVYRKQF